MKEVAACCDDNRPQNCFIRIPYYWSLRLLNESSITRMRCRCVIGFRQKRWGSTPVAWAVTTTSGRNSAVDLLQVQRHAVTHSISDCSRAGLPEGCGCWDRGCGDAPLRGLYLRRLDPACFSPGHCSGGLWGPAEGGSDAQGTQPAGGAADGVAPASAARKASSLLSSKEVRITVPPSPCKAARTLSVVILRTSR